MTNFKLYGKTFIIKDKIKEFAESIDAFTKVVDKKVFAIVLTDAKTTKGRIEKIMNFADINNLKCFPQKYDGSKYAPSNKNYSGFGKSIE